MGNVTEVNYCRLLRKNLALCHVMATYSSLASKAACNGFQIRIINIAFILFSRKNMNYYHLRELHIFLVISTYTLFFLRGIWSFNDSAMLQRRWIKTTPHVVDTLLLIVGLTLAFTIHQYPFVDTWLTAKMIGLLLYVGLGYVALNKGINKKIRVLSWLFAQMVFAYIVLVAITRNPLPY